MQDFKHFDPKQAAMDEARGLLEAAAAPAMADGSLPEKELPAFVVEVPNDVKNGDLASNFAMAGRCAYSVCPRVKSPRPWPLRCPLWRKRISAAWRSRAPASSTCSLPRAGLPT